MNPGKVEKSGWEMEAFLPGEHTFRPGKGYFISRAIELFSGHDRNGGDGGQKEEMAR
jgi:hypothetical protein